MTRLELQTDFLVAYYYHAAKDAAATAMSQTLPDSLQNAIVGVIMSQCALEGYINYQINLHGIGSRKVTIQRSPGDSPKPKKLTSLSIRDKWEQLPTILAGHSWTISTEPFKSFAELVEHRNDLVHFDAAKFVYESTAPSRLSTVSDILGFTKDGSWLAGSKVARLAAIGIAGHLIVRDMILELHLLLNTDSPSFLKSEKILYSVTVHQQNKKKD